MDTEVFKARFANWLGVFAARVKVSSVTRAACPTAPTANNTWQSTCEWSIAAAQTQVGALTGLEASALAWTNAGCAGSASAMATSFAALPTTLCCPLLRPYLSALGNATTCAAYLSSLESACGEIGGCLFPEGRRLAANGDDSRARRLSDGFMVGEDEAAMESGLTTFLTVTILVDGLSRTAVENLMLQLSNTFYSSYSYADALDAFQFAVGYTVESVEFTPTVTQTDSFTLLSAEALASGLVAPGNGAVGLIAGIGGFVAFVCLVSIGLMVMFSCNRRSAERTVLIHANSNPEQGVHTMPAIPKVAPPKHVKVGDGTELTVGNGYMAANI